MIPAPTGAARGDAAAGMQHHEENSEMQGSNSLLE